MELAVLRDPDEEMSAFLAYLEEPLHHGELLRELGEGAVDRYDASFEVVREVDCGLAFDQTAIFVNHVPRLFFSPLLCELEQRAVQLVLGRDELLEGRDTDHALNESPILSSEGVAVERVPQETDRDEGEPPA